MTSNFQIPLSAQQMQALKACARQRRKSCHAVVIAALAQVLAPYMGKVRDEVRAAEDDGGPHVGPVPSDAESDYLEDQLLRRLAGLPPAPE